MRARGGSPSHLMSAADCGDPTCPSVTVPLVVIRMRHVCKVFPFIWQMNGSCVECFYQFRGEKNGAAAWRGGTVETRHWKDDLQEETHRSSKIEQWATIDESRLQVQNQGGKTKYSQVCKTTTPFLILDFIQISVPSLFPSQRCLQETPLLTEHRQKFT